MILLCTSTFDISVVHFIFNLVGLDTDHYLRIAGVSCICTLMRAVIGWLRRTTFNQFIIVRGTCSGSNVFKETCVQGDVCLRKLVFGETCIRGDLCSRRLMRGATERR